MNLHLSAVDVVLLHAGEDFLVESGAMRACRRSIFDDHHLGVGRPERPIPERRHFEKLGRVDLGLSLSGADRSWGL